MPFIGHKLYESLSKERISSSSSVFGDIFDGRLYRELDMHIQPDALRLSVVMNTDGVAVFKSSNYSMWPIL